MDTQQLFQELLNKLDRIRNRRETETVYSDTQKRFQNEGYADAIGDVYDFVLVNVRKPQPRD